jgi:mannose-6-phosphate isomerase-like protein (cupin superfamily)
MGIALMTGSPSEAVPPVGRLSETTYAAPDGSDIRIVVGETERATAASLCQATLSAGETSRAVRHRQVEEIWYFLEGDGVVWRCPPDADPASIEPVAVRPGDALVIPPGWSFQFRASMDGPLRFLCYTAPPWPGPDEAAPAPHSGLGAATV